MSVKVEMMNIMSDKNAMTKREIIKEISDVTHLKQEVVKSVIDAFSDILIREAVMTGKFNLANCFSIKTHTRKAGKQYNVNKGEFQEYPETEILNITLSRKIHNFHRWKQRHEYNEKHGLTVEDWRNRDSPDIPK
jgi:nucleoid DNA-binding protein